MAQLLIVDDEETLARNVARFLERGGHAVTIAGTLAEAEAAFARLAPDAVVLDYQLPDGTGLAFALDRLEGNFDPVWIKNSAQTRNVHLPFAIELVCHDQLRFLSA